MNQLLLEKTFELLKERSSFCDVYIGNADHFTNEQMDMFLKCHDDFENGILIVSTLRRKGIDSEAREKMIEFMKKEILVHVEAMIKLCKEQLSGGVMDKKSLQKINANISFLNDCCDEILFLN